MFDGITLGQYVAGYSPLHRLDPRAKLAAVAGFSLAVLLAREWQAYTPAALFLLAAVTFSGLPARLVLRPWRPVLWLVAFVVIAHSLGTPGPPLVRLGPLAPSYAGLLAGLLAGLRLLLLVTGAALLTLTTRPLDLVDAITALLSPASRLGLPVGELSLLLGLALRFVPTLAEEAAQVRRAQASRGGGWDSGTLRERAEALVALVIPLLVRSLKRADELAAAMAARCYEGGKGRTSLSTLRWRPPDTLAVAASALLVIWSVVSSKW